MATVPYPLTAQNLEELQGQIYEVIRQLYEERIGGADLGDVFSMPGDVLTLATSDSGGLSKTNNELGVKLDGTSLTLSANGLKVTNSSTTSGSVTVVTSIQAGGAGGVGFQYKTRDLTIANGLVTGIGAETGWTDV